MGISRRLGSAALVVAMGVAGLGQAPAAVAEQAGGQLVRQTATTGTPHVLDGRVSSVERVGGTMVLGGSFSQARNHAATEVLSRTNLLAFDLASGQISTTFLPQPNGPVLSVLASGDGQSVFVGGKFTSIGGQARKNLARVRLSDGAVLPFDAGQVSGQVKDLELADGRLWVAGQFTHVAGRAQAVLATLDPQTGAFLPHMGLAVEGTHNGGTTQVIKVDVTRDGRRLAAIGNFATVGGQPRRQLVQLDLAGTTAAVGTFSTPFFTSACKDVFDSYLRDVAYSPAGDYFVVTTTGGSGALDSACDSTSRFESSSGAGVAPSWVNHTGGDTLHGVEITDAVIYVGGHFRWQNNPYGRDSAGAGAVSREGLAALDPSNGLPYDWNPTRTRGVGAFDFVHDDSGLWVASDTDRIGTDYRFQGRIARLAGGGAEFPVIRPATLPNDVYRVGSTSVTVRSLRGAVAGPERAVEGLSASTVKGAFMVNGLLYVAQSDGSFTRRAFDGRSFGTVEPVNTSDLISPNTTWRDDLRYLTGMFYDNGRIYYTRSGSTQLHYRYFTPQSGVVGARRLTAANSLAGLAFADVRGMFYADGRLYWSDSGGTLRSIAWQHQPTAGTPVAGTATSVSGPAVDGVSWSARDLFLFQDASGRGAALEPQAAFTFSCSSLTCTFDGRGSVAPGGQVARYDWTFGDGSTGVGATAASTYPQSGAYSVTLRITTTSGATSAVTQRVSVTRVNQAPTAAFTARCAGLVCSFDSSGSGDADGPVSHAWSFGDGRTGTGAGPTHTYAQEGVRTVRLTVTDSDGQTATASREVSVSQARVAWVAGSSANANTDQHRVRVPAEVQEGDLLLLHLALNTDTSLTGPAGWTRTESLAGNGMSGGTWVRRATAQDAGALVTLSAAATSKGDATVVAYRGEGGRRAVVLDSAGLIDATSATQHVSPRVDVPAAGGWLVTYWASKASVDNAWDGLGGQVRRTGSAGVGGGRITAALADSAAALPVGPAGGLTATTSAAVSRALSVSTVVGLE